MGFTLAVPPAAYSGPVRVTTYQRSVEHCRVPSRQGWTPSDFPLAGLDQASLDRLLARGEAVEDLYPLSPMQEGILFHSLLDTSADPYLNQYAFFLSGDLDVPALRQAWSAAMERHSILRTAFLWEWFDRPLQVVHSQVTIEWQERDWYGLEESEAGGRLASWLEEDRVRGLWLTAPPLTRFALMHLDQGCYFVWSVHHLLVDAWSGALLLREVFELYEGLQRRAALALPAVYPYRDFIAWLGRQDLAAGEVFWRRSFAGFDGPVPIGLGPSGRLPAAVPAVFPYGGVEPPSTPMLLPPTPDCAAYVIYTSGSTGRPKGVVVSHRSVAHHLTAMDLCLGAAPGIWLAATSISFDPSVLELLWTLTRGFTVMLAGYEPGERLSMVQAVERGVTHFQCTPTRARMLLLEPKEAIALRRLRRLLVGGEVLPADLVQRLLATGVPVVYNVYGPTETTVWSTLHRVEAGERRIPVGRALANVALYVLDRELCPVALGVAGELYIGGEGVARGYHRRPELTAERFVPDGLSGCPGARLYRTGDVMRWLGGGRLDFLGRTDYQVKVRGVRIELGEVETTLSSHPGVREAAVVSRADATGEHRLAAYIVGWGKTPDFGELRRFLGERLPEAMVPAAFFSLTALP